MKEIIDQLIAEAKKLLADADPVHGIEHSKAVADLCSEIAANFDEIDRYSLVIAAWWHDVGRKDNEENHGEGNSKYVRKKLAQKGFPQDYIEKVEQIIADHSVSKEKDFLLMTLESKIFHDADKLDLISPYRWKLATDNQASKLIEGGIERLPKILDCYLILDCSKMIYARKLQDFKKYILSVESEFFRPYKNKILRLGLWP